jgi:hypothetical protein
MAAPAARGDHSNLQERRRGSLAGVDVISVGTVLAEEGKGEAHYTLVAHDHAPTTTLPSPST